MSPMRVMSAECVKRLGGEAEEGLEASERDAGGVQEGAVEGLGDNAEGGQGTPAAGYVEFFPVEWFAEV